MSKKFILILSLIIFLVGGCVGYYLHQLREKTQIEYSLLNEWRPTYIDKNHAVAVQYVKGETIYMQSDESLSLSSPSDTKPYIIRFEKTPHQNFQSWYDSQTWPGNEKDYIFSTSTRGQPLVISDITETLYMMIRPGTLITIENAKSSEGNYHSDKGLLEMAMFYIKPIKIHTDGFYEVEEIEE